MDLLICNEVLYKDHHDDELGLGGLRSLPDPALLADQRVLDNVLRGCQGVHCIVDYFSLAIQKEIKPHMRKIVTDWMLEVTEEEKCSPEVFSLAVNYMDRILSQVNISKHQFQLLGSVCIFLASKFKESSPLCAEKLVICSDFSFTTEEIMKWELMVLELLNWDLSAITPYCILDQLLRRLIQPLHDLRGHFQDLQSIRNYAETLLNLAITESDFLTTPPSLIAVASLITAMSSLNQKPSHDEPLVANFLQNLFDLTGLNLQEVATVINNLEVIVRARISFDQQKSCTYSNTPSPHTPHTPHTPHQTTIPPPVSRTPTELVKASTTCVC